MRRPVSECRSIYAKANDHLCNLSTWLGRPCRSVEGAVGIPIGAFESSDACDTKKRKSPVVVEPI